MNRTLESVTSQVEAANYRARALNLPATLTVEQWLTMLNWQEWRCGVCVAVSVHLSPDHWIPLMVKACPGSVYSNIVPLCEKCNLSKNSTEPSVWMVKQGYDEELMSHVTETIREMWRDVEKEKYNTYIPPIHQFVIDFDMSISAERVMWNNLLEQSKTHDNPAITIKNYLWLHRRHTVLYSPLKDYET